MIEEEVNPGCRGCIGCHDPDIFVSRRKADFDNFPESRVDLDDIADKERSVLD
jgi:hypothetical protein